MPPQADPPDTSTETTPLLAAAAPPSADDPDRPLPGFQLVLLSIARVCEPLAFFSIFTFVQQQINELGVPADSVGFYTGLVESLFSLTQMCCMLLWGKASDRYGRKPILVISLLGVAVAQTCFGLATTIAELIVFRCLAGLCAGTVVTVRTMFSEVSTPKTQARAFSYFAFAGNLGIFAGPLIGGFLAKPAENWPKVFGNFHLFIRFPYLLPCGFTGALCAGTAVLCFFFLDETLKPEQVARTKAHGGTSVRELLAAPGVKVTMAIYLYIMLLGLAYTAVVPVFWFTPVELGGYGWSPMIISLMLAFAGISQAIWLLVVYPWLEKPHRLRNSGVLRLTSWGWAVTLPFPALLNLFLRRGWVAPFWTIVPLVAIVAAGVSMSFTAGQLAINNICPSPAVLGTMNGLALSLTSGVRAFAPGIFASLFATGVKHQILGGELIWAVLCALAAGLVCLMRQLPLETDGKIDERIEDTQEAQV